MTLIPMKLLAACYATSLMTDIGNTPSWSIEEYKV
jgi:hypothetical protein